MITASTARAVAARERPPLDPDGRPVPALSALETVTRHLLPGIGLLLFMLLAAPVLDRRGLPPGMAWTLGALLVAVPIQLGTLAREARRRNASWSLRGVVSFRTRLTRRQYVAIGLPLLVWGFLALAVTAPLSTWLRDTVFSWLPGWVETSDVLDTRDDYAFGVVLAYLVLNLIVDGFINPVTEELYFRGYLLPRLWRLGWLAPAVNATLFTLGHLWQPHNWPLILLISLPIVYAVWWKRSLWIYLMLHSFANTLGGTLTLAAFLID